MLLYELCEKLKKAGFPWKPDRIAPDCDCPYYESGTPNPHNIECHNAYKPTLSELIEACGDGFQKLEKVEVWSAYWSPIGDDGSGLEIESGKTPKIAVIKLWLKLNEK